MEIKTLILVVYNDKYGNGNSITNEVIVRSEADFNRWRRERNSKRIDEGEMPETADEFTLHYINLVTY